MKRLLILPIISAALMALPQGAIAQAQWTWTTVNSGTPNQLNSVIWTGSRFVVVGAGGTVLTSPDAINWTPQSSGSTSNLRSVIWTGSRFVVVGAGGTVLTSPDAVAWTTQNSGTTRHLHSVTWTVSQLVAVGGFYSGSSAFGWYNTILTSPDGITWTTRVTAGGGGNLNSVTWTGSQLVAVGGNMVGMDQNAYPLIITSPDGIAWTRRSGGQNILCSVTWTGSRLLTVGGWAAFVDPDVYSMMLYGSVFSSPDGITWTPPMGQEQFAHKSATYGYGRYVVVGNNALFINSFDGINWSSDSCSILAGLYSVTSGNAQCMFVAVGSGGKIVVYSLSSGTAVKTTPNSPALESYLHAKSRNSLLSISLPSSMLGKAVDLAVYTASGRVILQKRIARGTERLAVPAPGLSTGAYVLAVKDGIQKKAVRFVVVR